MNFEPSLSLCTSRTLHIVHELKKDDYIYKDLQNKYEQFVECLECLTRSSATVFKYRYDSQLLLLYTVIMIYVCISVVDIEYVS